MILNEGKYNVKARYNGVWSGLYEITVTILTSDDTPIVYSIETDDPEYSNIYYGKHELTVVTNTNVTRIKLVSKSGSEQTITPDGTNVQEVDGKLVWKFIKNFKLGSDQTYKVYARSKTQPFADSGVALTVDVIY